MKIEKVEFPIAGSKVNRFSLLADIFLKMEIKLPHIVTTLALLTDLSPHQGRLDLIDVGFYAHWEWDGGNLISLEITQEEIAVNANVGSIR